MKPYSTPPSRPCKQYALWLLGRREWSEKELAGRLAQRGYPLDQVAEAITYCQTHGLQSDTRYASSRSRGRSGSRGNQKILYELTQKGVSQDIAQEALQELAPEEDRAFDALRKFEGMALDGDLKARIWRHLAARGFSSDAIRKAIRRKEQGSDEG